MVPGVSAHRHQAELAEATAVPGKPRFEETARDSGADPGAPARKIRAAGVENLSAGVTSG